MLVQVQHGDGAEFRGHAAGLGDVGVHRVHQCLHDGVVGGVQVIRQREGTLPVAVKRLVARGRHNPVVPAHVAEVHVQRVPAAVPVALAAPLLGAALGPAGQRVALPVVPEGDQQGAQLVPVLPGGPGQGSG